MTMLQKVCVKMAGNYKFFLTHSNIYQALKGIHPIVYQTLHQQGHVEVVKDAPLNQSRYCRAFH